MCICTSTPFLAAPVEALDFFIPKSTRYHDITSPVKHKQSWSTWRGLSSAHAEDLAVCELEFRHVIQQKVAAYVDGFLDSSARQDSIFTVKVNLFELAAEIRDVYYETSQLLSPLMNLPSLVQFVRLHDCFVRPTSTSTQREPFKARIRVKMSQKSSMPAIVVYTPRLVFDDLVVQVQQGQNYYLKPRYNPVFTASKHAGCAPRVTYTTTCGWLRYNEEENYFAGTVPESNGAAQKIEVKATVVYRFPDTDISHEEIIRAAVKILPVAPSVEFEHPGSIPFIKQVRFANDAHAWKAPDDQQLRSRNSFSVLENCSNMDQDRRRMAAASLSDDVANAPWFPVSESDEVVASSSRLAAGTHLEQASLQAGSQSFEKTTGLDNTYSEPENIQSGIRSFYNTIGYDTGSAKDNTPRSEPGDDGTSNQICENVRKTFQVEFALDEDPRDVREMKKELLQMELEDLSKSMLGFRIDRWSSENASGELSDVQETSEASELECTLRESMGYCG